MKKEGAAVEKVSTSRNYFDYFNIEMKFDIDSTELDEKYLELQSKHHPDSFPAQHESKKLSQQNSILINKAYLTLKSPLTRAEYLLSLLLKRCDIIKPNKGLLAEIMEMREHEKCTDSFLTNTYNKCIQKINEAFVNQDLILMSHHTIRLKYILKIKEDICN